MKNWKRRLTAGVLALTMCVGSPFYQGETVQARQMYDRRDNVAEEELETRGVDAVGATSKKKVDPKAWKKIDGVCYNGSGVAIPGAITRGIDVSEWQEEINWQKVKNSDVDFAFIRISHSLTHMDYLYDYNMTEAISAGIPVGTYIYSTAVTKAQAIKEAQLAIRKMEGYKISYPVVFDLEDEKTTGRLPARQISEIAVAFCDEIRKAGYTPMLYMNRNWYNNYVDWSILREAKADVWMACYGDTIPAPDRSVYDYTIWQSTSGDTSVGLNTTVKLIDGIPGYDGVDVNFGFVDYTKKITPRTRAKAGYVPSSTTEKNKDGIYQEGGKTYYYENGHKVSGWKEIQDEYYYFREDTCEMVKDELIRGEKTLYYVDTEGKRYTGGWLTKDGKYYYFKPDGLAASGATKIGGDYYYFNSKNFARRRHYRYVTKGKNVYYFGSDGKWLKNKGAWITVNGKRVYSYFGSNGRAYTGWHTIRGKKYYFYSKKNKNYAGIRAQSVTLTDSKGLVSVFDSHGVCVKQYQQK